MKPYKIPKYTLNWKQQDIPCSKEKQEEYMKEAMCLQFASALYQELEVTEEIDRLLPTGEALMRYTAEVHVMTPSKVKELVASLRRLDLFERAADHALATCSTKLAN